MVNLQKISKGIQNDDRQKIDVWRKAQLFESGRTGESEDLNSYLTIDFDVSFT